MPHSSAGLGMAMTAVGGAFRWSALAREGPETEATAQVATHDGKPASERETLDFLAARGVPVIPQKTARSATEAGAIAAELGGPVVLKVLSPDIAHKTEVGGVALNIVGAEAAAREYEAMIARVAERKPDAAIEGIIVSPMRSGGLELIVGVARDPAWGLVLAVGMGGVLVELLGDADLSLLPVTPAKVEKMLGRFKGGKLLDGYRGQPAVDRSKLAEVIAAIGNAAIAMDTDLLSLEVNPLRVAHDGIECLDALAIWDED
jgi:acyl-CoA synthetase (NDP forming)